MIIDTDVGSNNTSLEMMSNHASDKSKMLPNVSSSCQKFLHQNQIEKLTDPEDLNQVAKKNVSSAMKLSDNTLQRGLMLFINN